MHYLACKFDPQIIKKRNFKTELRFGIISSRRSYKRTKEDIERKKSKDLQFLFLSDAIELLDTDSLTAKGVQSLEKLADTIIRDTEENYYIYLAGPRDLTLSVEALKLLAHKKGLSHLSDEKIESLKAKSIMFWRNHREK